MTTSSAAAAAAAAAPVQSQQQQQQQQREEEEEQGQEERKAMAVMTEAGGMKRTVHAGGGGGVGGRRRRRRRVLVMPLVPSSPLVHLVVILQVLLLMVLLLLSPAAERSVVDAFIVTPVSPVSNSFTTFTATNTRRRTTAAATPSTTPTTTTTALSLTSSTSIFSTSTDVAYTNDPSSAAASYSQAGQGAGQGAAQGAKGEADLALERGLRLDKSGQPRLANSCFLEAATLLQCYLELPHNFAYVTNLEAQDRGGGEDDDASSASSTTSSTTTSTSEVHAVLAYTLIRLAFNNLDALSDSKAACRLYEMAALTDSERPSATSFAGLGTAIEASAPANASGGSNSNNNNNKNKDLDFLHDAITAYRRALEIAYPSQLPLTKLSLAVALERLGHRHEKGHATSSSSSGDDSNDENNNNPYLVESTQILEEMSRQESPVSCYVDSWGYVRWHTRKTLPSQLNLHRGTRDMLKLALEAAMPLILPSSKQDNNNGSGSAGSAGSGGSGGLVCEFGVGNGRSLRMTQELLPLSVEIHGFDTFTGLPQAWHNEPAGTYSTGGVVPQMDHTNNVYFHQGLFSDTLQPFLTDKGEDAYVAYANIDCDLYTSTLDILEAFHGRLRVGSILVFDEYICHPTWRQDEFRAWRECCKRFGWTYEYLAFSLGTKQAVVKITSVA